MGVPSGRAWIGWRATGRAWMLDPCTGRARSGWRLTCGGGTARAPGFSGWPSRLQNFAPGRLAYPHFGQIVVAGMMGVGCAGTMIVLLGDMAGICTVTGATTVPVGKHWPKAIRLAPSFLQRWAGSFMIPLIIN